jgi:hypothetical protein
MKSHSFGTLTSVSTLTLGGGGLGMLWGSTTFDESLRRYKLLSLPVSTSWTWHPLW